MASALGSGLPARWAGLSDGLKDPKDKKDPRDFRHLKDKKDLKDEKAVPSLRSLVSFGSFFFYRTFGFSTYSPWLIPLTTTVPLRKYG